MSKRANPTAIGLFMIGAIVLTIGGIATFATASWFEEQNLFISYFDESVHGLIVGAPVKFKGVPVGQVQEIRIRIDLDEQTFQVPVVYDIDLDHLSSESDAFVDLEDREVLQQQISSGLRAQLQMESIVTGMLYVELTYVSDPEPVVTVSTSPLPVIPTAPSLFASFSEQAGDLVSGFQAFDISKFNRNLMMLLVNANEKLEAVDAQEINASLIEAARSIKSLAQAPEIRNALQEIPGISEQLNQTLLETQRFIVRLDTALTPIPAQLEATNQEVTLTLQALRRSIEGAQQLLSTDNALGYQLEEALTALTEAAEAFQLLSRSLEENPGSLLRGKRQPD